MLKKEGKISDIKDDKTIYSEQRRTVLPTAAKVR